MTTQRPGPQMITIVRNVEYAAAVLLAVLAAAFLHLGIHLARVGVTAATKTLSPGWADAAMDVMGGFALILMSSALAGATARIPNRRPANAAEPAVPTIALVLVAASIASIYGNIALGSADNTPDMIRGWIMVVPGLSFWCAACKWMDGRLQKKNRPSE